jgi:hypothetical protein
MDLEFEATSGDMQGRGSSFRPHNVGGQNTPSSTSIPERSVQIIPSARSGDTTFSEAYHFTGMDNYGLWSYKMSNILKHENLFVWYIIPAPIPITKVETR